MEDLTCSVPMATIDDLPLWMQHHVVGVTCTWVCLFQRLANVVVFYDRAHQTTSLDGYVLREPFCTHEHLGLEDHILYYGPLFEHTHTHIYIFFVRYSNLLANNEYLHVSRLCSCV
jgi:hypothetical protein